MKRSSKFSAALHALMHLAEQSSPSATSATLAACMQTNPVVVRRTLGELREAGFVIAVKGPGGGWSLARPPSAISLADIYNTLGGGLFFAIDRPLGRDGCLIEHAIGGVLDTFFSDAELLLRERLAKISLNDILSQVQGVHAAKKFLRRKTKHEK